MAVGFLDRKADTLPMMAKGTAIGVDFVMFQYLRGMRLERILGISKQAV